MVHLKTALTQIPYDCQSSLLTFPTGGLYITLLGSRVRIDLCLMQIKWNILERTQLPPFLDIYHHLTDHIRSLGVFDILHLIGELEGIKILLLPENLGQVGKSVLE